VDKKTDRHGKSLIPNSYTGGSDSYAGFITLCPKYSRFFMGFVPILQRRPLGRCFGYAGMAFDADHTILLDRIDEALRVASEPTAELFSKIIASICVRFPALGKTEKANQFTLLVEAGAWTDAACALIELELPALKVRRLAYENGEWLCSLSRQPNLPLAMDDTVDVFHEALPLAILRAFVETRRRSRMVQESVSAVPQIQQPMTEHIMCCDNFA
jgi:hypothetical protein